MTTIPAQHRGRAIGALGIAVLVAAVASIARRTGALPALVGGALLLFDLILVRWAVRPRAAGSTLARSISLVSAAWVAVALVPLHDIGRQSAQSAVSTLTLQTATELVVYGAAGLLATHLLRTTVPVIPLGVPLTVLPVWVVASAAWGATPAYALARGLEYVALAVLAMATAGLIAAARPNLDQVVSMFLRRIVWVTLGLIGLGVALGPLFVVVTASNRDRFTWIGAHPTESGFLLGAALLVLLATGAARLRLPPAGRVAAIGVVVVAMQQNQTRTTLAGVVVGVVVLLALRARRDPDRGLQLGFVTLGSAVAGLLLAGGAVSSYVLRDEGTARLTTLNGRTDLWGVGFDALDGPMAWLHGLGFGATRYVFIDQFAFAGDAHNSLLGTLVGLGLVGVALLLAAVVRAGLGLWRDEGLATSDGGTALLVLLTYAVVAGATSDDLAQPHLGLTILFLATAVAAGWRHGTDGSPSPRSPSATRQSTTPR